MTEVIINEIRDVSSLWTGGFISGDTAMYKINKLLKSKTVKDVVISNSISQEEIVRLDKALINIEVL